MRAFLLVLLHGVLGSSAPAVVRAASAPHPVTVAAATDDRELYGPRVLESVPEHRHAIIRPAPVVSVVAIERIGAILPFVDQTSSPAVQRTPWTVATQLALDRSIALHGADSHVVAARGRLRPFHSTAPPQQR